MSLGLLTVDCWFKMTRGKMYALSSGIQSHCFSRFATRFNCLLLAHMLKFPQLVVKAGEHHVFLEFENDEGTNEWVGGWIINKKLYGHTLTSGSSVFVNATSITVVSQACLSWSAPNNMASEPSVRTRSTTQACDMRASSTSASPDAY